MTTRRSQLQEDTYYRVLRMLQDNPDLTQREIASQLGISSCSPKLRKPAPTSPKAHDPAVADPASNQHGKKPKAP